MYQKHTTESMLHKRAEIKYSATIMTLTTHSAIGAAIGFNIGNPLLGFILGAMSHFLVDMIPHGDSDLGKKFRSGEEKRRAVLYSGTDAIVAILFILAVFNFSTPAGITTLSASIAGSVAPDLFTLYYEITKTKWLKGYHKMHFFFHDFVTSRYKDVKLTYALIGQAVFIAILLFVAI